MLVLWMVVLPMAFIIQRTVFLKVLLAKVFCSFHDYSWNFSVHYCFCTTTGSCHITPLDFSVTWYHCTFQLVLYIYICRAVLYVNTVWWITSYSNLCLFILCLLKLVYNYTWMVLLLAYHKLILFNCLAKWFFKWSFNWRWQFKSQWLWIDALAYW